MNQNDKETEIDEIIVAFSLAGFKKSKVLTDKMVDTDWSIVFTIDVPIKYPLESFYYCIAKATADFNHIISSFIYKKNTLIFEDVTSYRRLRFHYLGLIYINQKYGIVNALNKLYETYIITGETTKSLKTFLSKLDNSKG